MAGSAASTLVASVPAPSYSANSEELAAFRTVNAERQACGFGQLAQRSTLDTAAQGHADWNLINGFFGHFQTTGTQGFTGVADRDRLLAAGYSPLATDFSVSDLNVVIDGGTSTTGMGADSIRALLNAPYHSIFLLDGYKDIGLSVRSTNDVTRLGSAPTGRTLQVNLAYKFADQAQLIASNDVMTYPCQGSTGVVPALRGESPNPVPGRDLGANPLGSTITLLARQGQQLVITSASLTRVDDNTTVSLRMPVTSANDPNAGFLRSHHAYVSADAPMASNTTYRAVMSGTNNGVAFSKDFTFTTGLDSGI